jgi:Phosphate-selective porin O and P
MSPSWHSSRTKRRLRSYREGAQDAAHRAHGGVQGPALSATSSAAFRELHERIEGRVLQRGFQLQDQRPHPCGRRHFQRALSGSSGSRTPLHPVQAASGYANQVGIRQARLQVEGTAFKIWDYRFQYEFTGAGNGLIVGGIRDAFLVWRYFQTVTFQIGNFFEPFVLTRTDSYLCQTFMERSIAEVLTPGHHLGFGAETGAALTGVKPPGIGNPDWSLKGGIFSTSVDQGCTSCAGAPAAGSSAFLAPVPGGHQFWDAAARLTHAPILTEDSLADRLTEAL